jgi:hypothetical protein
VAGQGTPLAQLTSVRELSISGVECVEALCAAGFRVRRRTAGRTVLARDGRLVVVPDALVLSPALLDSILEEADLSAEKLVWLMGEVSTETEIPCEGG